jgi:RNA polymerase sigma factor (sigma-70 family)
MSATSSDAELISAVRAGDADAYGILYARHYDRVLRLARHIVPAQADAEDVVAETFVKVLAAIKGGSGPTEAFVPYVLTATRRVAFAKASDQRTELPADSADLIGAAGAFPDPAEAVPDRTLIARAFEELPERWAAVLWHTEVEQYRPAELALLLGISPNNVAALRYRAREGLRQAYLQAHLSVARPGCQPAAGLLGGYVRGTLSRRDAKLVDEHLSRCGDCQAALAELDAINGSMRGMLAPVVLGGAAAGYLAHSRHFAAAARWISPVTRSLKRVPWNQTAVQLTAGIAVAAAIALAVTLSGPHSASPSATGPFGISSPGSTGPVSGSQAAGAPASPGQPVMHRPAPSSSPTRSGSNSPNPSPSGTSSPTPAPSATATAPPSPSPSRPGVSAKLSVVVKVSGLLNLGVVDTVAVSVSDPGTAATQELNVTLGLPSGLTLLGLGSGSSGWTCSGTSCTHAGIAAGAASTVSFRILVANLSACGNPVTAKAASGTLSASGRSSKQVRC